jgi:hypothetical protein
MAIFVFVSIPMLDISHFSRESLVVQIVCCVIFILHLTTCVLVLFDCFERHFFVLFQCDVT